MSKGQRIVQPDLKGVVQAVLELDEIKDASVWLDKGTVKIYVTPHANAVVNVERISAACVQFIGEEAHPPDVRSYKKAA